MRLALSPAMRCVAVPSASMRARLGVMYPELGAPRSRSVAGVFDDLVKVEGLAAALSEALETCRTVDGRVDERDVGAHVLRYMVPAGGAVRPSLGELPASRDQANVESTAVDTL